MKPEKGVVFIKVIGPSGIFECEMHKIDGEWKPVKRYKLIEGRMVECEISTLKSR